MRVVVTGIGGFAGGHLAAYLVEQGEQVVGFLRRAGQSPSQIGPSVHRMDLLTVDLTDSEMTREYICESSPDLVIHLAAASSPSASVACPAETMQANVVGTASVLAAAVASRPMPRVVMVTSSDIYGPEPPDGAPLTEETPFAPRNPYAVSKVACHYLGQQFHHLHGLEVIEARPFNHLGPGQRAGFVASDFALQIIAIEQRRQPAVVKVGNLEVQRDFTDVRDVVRAYYQLALRGEPGEVYHICSGRPVSVRKLLDRLILLTGLDIRVEVDEEKFRPDPAKAIVGSAAKLKALCGWEPQIPIETSLRDILADWRQKAG